MSSQVTSHDLLNVLLADNHDVISLKVYDVDGPGAIPPQNMGKDQPVTEVCVCVCVCASSMCYSI